ncbi:hypothetical protein O7A70_19390 [Mesorhizobium sp. Cs1299R1N1]
MAAKAMLDKKAPLVLSSAMSQLSANSAHLMAALSLRPVQLMGQ